MPKTKKTALKASVSTENIFKQKIAAFWGSISPFYLAIAALLIAAIGELFVFPYAQLSPEGLAALKKIFFFIRPEEQPAVNTGFFLMFLAGILFIGAVAKGPGDVVTQKETGKVPLAVEMTLAALLLLTGGWLRMTDLGGMPAGVFGDEGFVGVMSIKLMNLPGNDRDKFRDAGEELPRDQGPFPVYLEGTQQTGTFYNYIQAATIRIFGNNVIGLRLPSGLLAVVYMAFFYLMARRMFGPLTALFGLGIFSFMRWDIAWARQGMGVGTAILSMVMGLYYGYRAYVDRKPGDFIGLGTAIAISGYGYLPGRTVVLIIAAFAALLLFIDLDFYRKNWGKMAVGAAVGILLLMPMIHYINSKGLEYLHRLTFTNVFDRNNVSMIENFYHIPFAKYVWDQAYHTATSFNRYSQEGFGISYMNGPLVGFFGGFLVLMGFAAMLLRPRRDGRWLLMAVIPISFAGSIFTMNMGLVNRLICLVPVCAVFAGYVLGNTWEISASQKSGFRKFLGLGLIAAITALYAYENYNVYFHLMEKANEHEHPVEERQAAEKLKSLGPNWYGYLEKESWDKLTFNYFIYPSLNYERFNPSDSLMSEKKNGTGYIFLLLNDYLPIVPSLQEMFPGGKLTVNNVYKHTAWYGFWYEAPPEAVKKYNAEKPGHGLIGLYYADNDFKGNTVRACVEPFVYYTDHSFNVLRFKSVVMKGRLKIDKPGKYDFSLLTNWVGGVYIDGKERVTAPMAAWQEISYTGEANLSKGMHDIEVRLKTDPDQVFVAVLSWIPPGEKKLLAVPYSAFYRK